MTTDWKKRLRQREAAIRRAEEARRQDIAAARLDGHSFREIGTWAGVNHERARQMCIDINGDSHPRAEQDPEPEPADA